jgi:uncharacterized protein
LFSHNRANLFSLRDLDHGDGTQTPLKTQIVRRLATSGIDLNGGRVLLLCMPRVFGYNFNPLSVYFCYDPADGLVALVYQVHNTFGDRHSYVVPVDTSGSMLRQSCGKDFYVSPFIDMEIGYRFRVLAPEERVAVAIRASNGATPVLNAALTGRRRALTDRALWRLAWSIPFLTMKVVAAIHWEALRLWLKGLRFHSRPREHGMVGASGTAAPGNRD